MRDSEIILGMLKEQGYKQAGCVEEADVVLFNTCSVRRHAEERVWGNVRMLGGTPPPTKKIVGLLGCMAQNYQGEIFRRFPQVDLVCGPANIYDIPGLLEKVSKEKVQVLAVDRQKRPLVKPDGFRKTGLKAYVCIMYGCNNFCSYCVVPYVRGKEQSRPLRDILDEVKDLAGRGFKEVTLLGQNVNSYGKDLARKMNFVRLLEGLHRIKGIERIRFISSHPKDATKALFKAMRDLPKVCEHLHLPLQAGSDKILRMMNRRYTLADYLKLIDCLRSMVSDSSLSTDIIVGFPGESKADFEKTYQAMQSIQFDEAFIFKYSPRPRTKAGQLRDNVPLEAKQQRNRVLLKLQEQICLKKNRGLLGKSVQVLIEGVAKSLAKGIERPYKGEVLQGRSRTNKVTLFPGERELIAQVVDVKVNRVSTHTLMGEVNGKRD